MTEIVRKVNAACAFGTPSAQIAGEIVEEVRDLVTKNMVLERLVTQVRQLCESDGVNPTVQAIRRAIDNAS